jgi:hypothetical protein
VQRTSKLSYAKLVFILAMAGAGEWPFSPDAYADSSAVFAELGCWATGLHGDLLPPLDPPEEAVATAAASVSSSIDDGVAREDAEAKPAAATEAA